MHFYFARTSILNLLYVNVPLTFTFPIPTASWFIIVSYWSYLGHERSSVRPSVSRSARRVMTQYARSGPWTLPGPSNPSPNEFFFLTFNEIAKSCWQKVGSPEIDSYSDQKSREEGEPTSTAYSLVRMIEKYSLLIRRIEFYISRNGRETTLR